MKAKKDGKLNASPDPYGVEEVATTKLRNMVEYIDNRMQMPSVGEYPTYQNGTVPNMGQMVGQIPHNYMMSPYESTVPKI